MHAGRVSVIIPSRNERYLQHTIDSLLTNSAGDVEVIVVLDGGPWPDPPLKDDKRLVVIRHNESTGMRPSINEAAQGASGQYLLKGDAHCIFGEGYDEILKADCDEDWLAVPTRHSIDGPTWERNGEKAAVRPRNWNHHFLTFPMKSSMYGAGFHAVTPGYDTNKLLNAERAQFQIDDLMSFQGSCWFQHTANFHRLGPLNSTYLGPFYQEAQELGLRQWITGGRCVLTRKTFVAHWHKGKESVGADGRQGRGFTLNLREKRRAEAFYTEYWINDRYPGATRTFESLIEQFWPLLSKWLTDPRYAWPADWRDWEKHRTWFENRKPEELPAHI